MDDAFGVILKPSLLTCGDLGAVLTVKAGQKSGCRINYSALKGKARGNLNMAAAPMLGYISAIAVR